MHKDCLWVSDIGDGDSELALVGQDGEVAGGARGALAVRVLNGQVLLYLLV